jgi:hypothetical protein
MLEEGGDSHVEMKLFFFFFFFFLRASLLLFCLAFV